MAARIGIELSATTCRIIEIDDGPGWKRDPSAPRVVSFASRPLTDPEITERLAALRGRPASVVVWTPHSNHRQVTVGDASYGRMRAEARAIAGVTSPDMPRLLSDIAPAAPHVAGMDRRTVLAATVPRSEVTAALRPLTEAGIKVRAVLTPASALTSLARMRRRTGVTETLEAYVAIEESASTIALVRGGVLLAARTMPWGYLSDQPAHQGVLAREEIAMRLASDLSVSMAEGQFRSLTLEQVSVCGGLPELRSMTVALMERLDVEVEPLDFLDDIDTEPLPEPAGEFRERAAELRMAWAAAADRRPVLDLFRQRKRLARTLALSAAAIVAGVAAGVGVSWVWHDQWIPASGEATHESTPAALPPFPITVFPPATVFSSPPRRPLESSAETESLPLPFEATLGTILYGPERKQAMVDGRIVQAGDEVRGAKVVEITPTAVYLRDAQGQLRRLAAGAVGR